MTPTLTQANPAGRFDLSPAARGAGTRYELRFQALFRQGRGFAFPCDAAGQVDIDSLGERALTNYFYARSVVGREFFAPVTSVVSQRGDA
jgi:hypothetical protein